MIELKELTRNNLVLPEQSSSILLVVLDSIQRLTEDGGLPLLTTLQWLAELCDGVIPVAHSIAYCHLTILVRV